MNKLYFYTSEQCLNIVDNICNDIKQILDDINVQYTSIDISTGQIHTRLVSKTINRDFCPLPVLIIKDTNETVLTYYWVREEKSNIDYCIHNSLEIFLKDVKTEIQAIVSEYEIESS